MMRALLGWTAVHAGFVVVGAGLLYAAGLVDLAARPLLRALGAAYLAGVALVLVLLIVLLVVGIPVGLPATAIVIVVSALALWSLGLLRRGGGRSEDRGGPAPAAPAHRGLALWVPRVAAALLGAYLLLATLAFTGLPTIVDDASFWSPKAIALANYAHLPREVFASPAYPHPDYPILQPLLESTVYRAMGRQAYHHAELWLLFAAFIGTVGFLLRGRSRLALWLPVMGALAAAPGVSANVTLGYADVTLSCFVGAGALALAIWVETQRAGALGLAALFLAAAANTKAEGLYLAIVLAVAAGAAALVAAPRPSSGRAWRRPELRAWGAAIGLAAAGILPWRVWLAAHDVRNEDVTPLGTSLRPSFLANHLHQLGDGARKVAQQLAGQGRWVWLFPAFAVAVAIAIRSEALRRVASFYTAAALGVAAVFLWVFWTEMSDSTAPFVASVDRYVTAVVFIAAVGVAHLFSPPEPTRGET